MDCEILGPRSGFSKTPDARAFGHVELARQCLTSSASNAAVSGKRPAGTTAYLYSLNHFLFAQST